MSAGEEDSRMGVLGVHGLDVAIHLVDNAADDAREDRLFGGDAQIGHLVALADEGQATGVIVQGTEAGGEAGRDVSAHEMARREDDVVRDGRTRIDDQQRHLWAERPGANGSGDAVAAEGLGCAIAKGDGQADRRVVIEGEEAAKATAEEVEPGGVGFGDGGDDAALGAVSIDECSELLRRQAGAGGAVDGLSAVDEDNFRGRIALIQYEIHLKTSYERMVTSYKSQVTVDWGSKAAAKKEKSESEHPTVIPVRLFGVVEPLTG